MNRAYKDADIKLLWYRSGGRCARCKLELSLRDRNTLIGNMAHIVALHPNGPRADPTFPQRCLNTYENLVLLCPTDHYTIDNDPEWTVKRVQDLKGDHESWVREALTWHESSPARVAEKHLFVLAGPSGVGKDVIVNRLLRRLESNGYDSDFLRRFTTRGPRPEEVPGRPYIYLSREEFQAKVGLGVISCVHPSFGNIYGCDSHFSPELPTGSAVLHTMRNLSFLGDMKDRAEARGLAVHNILIIADLTTLSDRIIHRTASAEEKSSRIGSTIEDLSWIAANKRKVAQFFDLKLENSDECALRRAVEATYSFIVSTLAKKGSQFMTS